MKRYIYLYLLLFLCASISTFAMDDSKKQKPESVSLFARENIIPMLSAGVAGIFIGGAIVGSLSFFGDHEAHEFIQRNQVPILIGLCATNGFLLSGYSYLSVQCSYLIKALEIQRELNKNQEDRLEKFYKMQETVHTCDTLAFHALNSAFRYLDNKVTSLNSKLTCMHGGLQRQINYLKEKQDEVTFLNDIFKELQTDIHYREVLQKSEKRELDRQSTSHFSKMLSTVE